MVRLTPLVTISLILIAAIVLGGVIRMTIFQRYIPEGFEDAKAEEEKEEEKKDEKGLEEAAKKMEEEATKGGDVKLDEGTNLKNFLNENGDNKKLMSSINTDTRAMIENQKELMDMMKTVQPALKQGMEFMKAFKGMVKQE
jgi:hypothetical protein